MIGGFLWCTGNMMSVPVIKLIGLSLGLLIWGTTNMLMGWSSGTFGFFGLKSHTPDNVALNYCGVCVAVCALALYTQIRATSSEDDKSKDDDKTVSLLENTTPTTDDDDVEKPKIRTWCWSAKRENISFLIHLLRRLARVTYTTNKSHPCHSIVSLTRNNTTRMLRKYLTRASRSNTGTTSDDPELDRMFNHYASNDHASLSSATPRLLGVDPYVWCSFVSLPNIVERYEMLNSRFALEHRYMKKSKSHGNRLYDLAQQQEESKSAADNENDVDTDGNTFIDRLPKQQKRLLGVCMAAVSGILYGTNFDPPQYLVDHGIGPTNMLDYVWSHFCGIFLTSTMYVVFENEI